MSRFVQPEEVTLPISDGDTLTVKKSLTEGEQRAAHARMYRPDTDGINPQEVGIAMVIAYLLDWTLTDAQGNKVLIRGKSPSDVQSVLDALHPQDFAEILDAINTHDRTEAQRRQEKKRQTRATVSTSTSRSAV